MAIWFLDTTNGNDAWSGHSSASRYWLNAPMTLYGGHYFLGNPGVGAIDDRLWMTCGALAGLYRILDLGNGTLWRLEKLSGDDLSSKLVTSSPLDGPVKTLTQLLTLVSPGDYGYSRSSTGLFTQVYPTSEPVSELAALALKAQLETVTVANGYTIDIGEILRPAAIYVPIPEDKQVIMRQPADRIADKSAGMCEHHKQEFALCLMMRCGESDTVAIDTHANRFHAAVRKALLADWTLSGTTIDVQVGDLEQVESEEAIACYALSVVLTYRHSDTNPYPA